MFLIIVAILVIVVGIFVAIQGTSLGLLTSEIISIEAVCVAIFFGILNLLYTQRTFKAKNFPIPLIRSGPAKQRDRIIFSVVNPHQRILISNVKVLIKIKYSRSNPNWYRYLRSVNLCKLSVKLVDTKSTKEAGTTPDLVTIMKKHFPNVLQSKIIGGNEEFKVTWNYSFDLIVDVSYSPHIFGGKEEHVTYQGTLKPIKTSDYLLLKRWDVEILEYPQPSFTGTNIG